jgi:MoaA/NifB/PqqE/SkfB family radical SAM enzyme
MGASKMIVIKTARFVLSHLPCQILNRLKVEAFHKRVVVNYSPCSLFIDVTTDCNMGCHFCSTKKHRHEYGFQNVPFSTAKKFLDKFRMADFVGFCGAGETFLNPDLFEIVKYAKELKMKVYVTTNGTLIHKRMNELLTSNLDTLEISLKETNASDYQRITDSKDFKLESMIAMIRELSELPQRPRLKMSYVWDRNRVHNVPHVIKIANQCGVDEVLFQNLIPDPILRNESQCLFEEDKEWAAKIINNCQKKQKKVIIRIPRFYTRNTFFRRCKKPYKTIRIGLDGGVSACPRTINPTLSNGSILYDEDVFNNAHFQKIRSELLYHKLPLRYECIYCEERC